MRKQQRFLSRERKGTGGREKKWQPESLVDERYRELVKIPPDGIPR